MSNHTRFLNVFRSVDTSLTESNTSKLPLDSTLKSMNSYHSYEIARDGNVVVVALFGDDKDDKNLFLEMKFDTNSGMVELSEVKPVGNAREFKSSGNFSNLLSATRKTIKSIMKSEFYDLDDKDELDDLIQEAFRKNG